MNPVSPKSTFIPADLLYEAIVDSSDDAIVSKDLHSTIMSWNKGAERIFGYSAEEMIGESIIKLLPPDRPNEEAQILARLQRGERVEHFETRRQRKDGRVIHVSLTISPIRNSEGVIVGASKIARDITEQKAALRKLAETHEQLQRADRVKTEFLTTLSHELRTPLNAILGWVQILKDGATEEDIVQGIPIIERNVRVQSQMIEDLLDMSRIEAGKVSLDVQRVDLAAVVGAGIETVRPAANAKEIRLTSAFGSVNGIVMGDKDRLQQIIWNLLSNSVKFTDKGGVIKIGIGRNESTTEIVVSDNGQGISEEFLPFVFDRFQQADSSITRKHGGLGLGLAISRHLVELHGGTIAVSSPGAGLGATFKVRLPVAAVGVRDSSLKSTTEKRESLSTIAAGAKIPNLSQFKVLAIDDAADARQLIRAVLEQFGADVLTASSVKEGLELLATWKPDVIVCDIGMPEEDGYTFISEVRRLSADQGGTIPAIALTGYVRVEDRMRALAAGYQMFVPKPVEATELASLIQAVMGVPH